MRSLLLKIGSILIAILFLSPFVTEPVNGQNAHPKNLNGNVTSEKYINPTYIPFLVYCNGSYRLDDRIVGRIYGADFIVLVKCLNIDKDSFMAGLKNNQRPTPNFPDSAKHPSPRTLPKTYKSRGKVPNQQKIAERPARLKSVTFRQVPRTAANIKLRPKVTTIGSYSRNQNNTAIRRFNELKQFMGSRELKMPKWLKSNPVRKMRGINLRSEDIIIEVALPDRQYSIKFSRKMSNRLNIDIPEFNRENIRRELQTRNQDYQYESSLNNPVGINRTSTGGSTTSNRSTTTSSRANTIE